MKISITDHCWICGNPKQITQHHALPLHLKPKKNILIPICEECHNRININDVLGLQKYNAVVLNEIKSRLKKVQLINKPVHKG